MGYHILLHCTAIIKPEYIDCIKMEYFYDSTYRDDWYDDDYDKNIPEKFKEFYWIWRDLSIYSDGSSGFYEFKIEGDRFTFTLCKRPYFYQCGNNWITLERDYKRLMRDIIAPLSIEILHCEIEHDDFGDARYTYTDEEVRDFYIT
jgi:hypothetical protein